MPRSTSSTSMPKNPVWWRQPPTAGASAQAIWCSPPATNFQRACRSAATQIASTWAIATVPQPRRLWPGECMIWEAADPYLYVRTTPDGRVICGGEDEEFSDEEKRDALLARKTATLQRKLKQLLPNIDTRIDFAWTGSFGAEFDRAADHRPGPAHAELLGGPRLRRQRHDLFADCGRRHCRRAGRAAGCGRRSLRLFTPQIAGPSLARAALTLSFSAALCR